MTAVLWDDLFAIDADDAYKPDPRGVRNCPRCGALARRGHDCEVFLRERGRIIRRAGIGDPGDNAEVEARRARGIWWNSPTVSG